jgi:Holliday junction resolvase RusA-like endonuclease
MYRRTRYTVVLSNDAMAYKKYAQVMAQRQYEYNEPLKGDLVVTYRFFGSRLDIDNGLKLLNDSCNGIIWEDDRQIVEAHVFVNRQDKRKRVEMEVYIKEFMK